MKVSKNVFIFGILISIFFCTSVRASLSDSWNASEPESMYYIFDRTTTTASLFREPVTSAPATVIVITAKEIKERGYQDLTEVLEDLPGFDVQNRIGGQPGGSYIIVRGLWGNNKLQVFVDGVPLNPENGTHLVYGHHISVQGLKQIEIMYGPASALYGANAFSGIVNLITKDVPKRPTSSIKVGAGNNDTFTGYFLVGGRIVDSFRMQLYGHGYRTSGFDMRKEYPGNLVDNGYGVLTPVYNPNWPYNTPEQDYDFILQAIDKGWHILSTYSRTRQPNNIQTPYYTGRTQLPRDKVVIDTLNIDTNKTVKISDNLKLRNDFWYQHYELEPDSDYGRITFNNYIYERSDAYQLDERFIYSFLKGKFIYGLNVKRVFAFPYINSHEPFNHGDVYNGFPLARVKSPSGEIINIPSIKLQNYWVFGNYLQLTQSIFDNLTLTLGARYDYDSSTHQGSFNPRVGLVYCLDRNQQIKLLLGTAYIPPSIYIRYKAWIGVNNQYAHLPSYLFDKKLKSEKLYSLELSHCYEYKHKLSSLISLYVEQAHDMIREAGEQLTGYTFYFKDGSVVNDAVVEIPTNSGIQTDFGVDILEKYRFLKHWSIYLGYSYLNAKIRLNGKTYNAPKVSNHKVKFGITGTIADLIGLNIRMRWWSGIYTTPYNPMYRGRKLKGALVVDANLRWIRWDPKWEIDFTVKNLFNTKYFTSGTESEDPTYGTSLPKIPQNPRQWLVSIYYHF